MPISLSKIQITLFINILKIYAKYRYLFEISISLFEIHILLFQIQISVLESAVSLFQKYLCFTYGYLYLIFNGNIVVFLYRYLYQIDVEN